MIQPATVLLAAARCKRDHKEPAEPPQVKAARKVITAWDRANWQAASERRSRIEKAQAHARERILFGTPEEALAAVQAFEKLTV